MNHPELFEKTHIIDVIPGQLRRFAEKLDPESPAMLRPYLPWASLPEAGERDSGSNGALMLTSCPK